MSDPRLPRRPERKPSAWSPRPIPQPAPERRTADPPTPTLKELAERERQRASLASTAVAWLELKYTHADDGSPMVGAPYRVRLANGSTHEGRLDPEGRARLDNLPPALAGTAVDIWFGEPSAAFRALPARAEPNPDYRPDVLTALTTPGGPMYAYAAGTPDNGTPRLTFASYRPGAAVPAVRDGLARAVMHAPDGPVHEVLEYLWSVVAGAYKQDPTSGEIVGQMVVAMVPLVGQIADVRDLSAYIYQLSSPDLAEGVRRAAWIGVVLTGIALLLPEVGPVVAGVGRLALKGGPDAERLALPLLRRVGGGNALKFLERELSATRIEEHATAALARVTGHLRQFFTAVERTWLPVSDAVRAAARRALDDLARVAAEARTAIKRVAAEIAAKVKPLLTKIERNGERAAGETDAMVERQAATEGAGRGPEPEGPGGSREPGRAARAFSPAQREMIDEMRQAGVKFDESKLLDLRRMPSGKIAFLEEGNARAGLQHIMRHASEFAEVGIAPERVPRAVMDALERGTVVGQQTPTRAIYEILVDGRRRLIAITTSENGFVVGANPRTAP